MYGNICLTTTTTTTTTTTDSGILVTVSLGTRKFSHILVYFGQCDKKKTNSIPKVFLEAATVICAV